MCLFAFPERQSGAGGGDDGGNDDVTNQDNKAILNQLEMLQVRATCSALGAARESLP